MEKRSFSPEVLALLKKMQQGETDEGEIYARIAQRVKDEANRATLLRLSSEEKRHASIWRGLTHADIQPNMRRVRWFGFIAAVFGYTFAIKLMENGEEGAQAVYASIAGEVPEAEKIRAEEEEHEEALIGILDEERLRYVGSMVLGLNDALVELSGTLAGLTFAYQNTRLIALSGLITGIAATLSLAASEFLSARSDGRGDALKSCAYTGGAYVVTVALLVLPYLLFDSAHYLYAMAVMLTAVVMIISVFNYYISVAMGCSFKKRFGEMCAISLGVALISFLIGLLVKAWLGVDV